MTVLLGPCPCASCGVPVTVVRRPVLIHDTNGTNRYQAQDHAVPSAELREVVAIDADERTHRCS